MRRFNKNIFNLTGRQKALFIVIIGLPFIGIVVFVFDVILNGWYKNNNTITKTFLLEQYVIYNI